MIPTGWLTVRMNLWNGMDWGERDLELSFSSSVHYYFDEKRMRMFITAASI